MIHHARAARSLARKAVAQKRFLPRSMREDNSRHDSAARPDSRKNCFQAATASINRHSGVALTIGNASRRTRPRKVVRARRSTSTAIELQDRRGPHPRPDRVQRLGQEPPLPRTFPVAHRTAVRPVEWRARLVIASFARCVLYRSRPICGPIFDPRDRCSSRCDRHRAETLAQRVTSRSACHGHSAPTELIWV